MRFFKVGAPLSGTSRFFNVGAALSGTSRFFKAGAHVVVAVFYSRCTRGRRFRYSERRIQFGIMKRTAADEKIVPSFESAFSHQTFFSLLSVSKILKIIRAIDNEELFASTVTDVFVESFVVVEKRIYNKSVLNTLNLIGYLNDMGVCLIRHLVSNTTNNLHSFLLLN